MRHAASRCDRLLARCLGRRIVGRDEDADGRSVEIVGRMWRGRLYVARVRVSREEQRDRDRILSVYHYISIAFFAVAVAAVAAGSYAAVASLGP